MALFKSCYYRDLYDQRNTPQKKRLYILYSDIYHFVVMSSVVFMKRVVNKRFVGVINRSVFQSATPSKPSDRAKLVENRRVEVVSMLTFFLRVFAANLSSHTVQSRSFS